MKQKKQQELLQLEQQRQQEMQQREQQRQQDFQQREQQRQLEIQRQQELQQREQQRLQELQQREELQQRLQIEQQQRIAKQQHDQQQRDQQQQQRYYIDQQPSHPVTSPDNPFNSPPTYEPRTAPATPKRVSPTQTSSQLQLSAQSDAMYVPALQPWREESSLAADPLLRQAYNECRTTFWSWGMELALACVNIECVIGTGAFAVVYKGKLTSTGAAVAVKKLLSTAGQQLTGKTLKDFMTEVNVKQLVWLYDVIFLLTAFVI